MSPASGSVDTTASTPVAGLPDAVLAWYFVVMWGSGFLATKTGLHFAAPFTFLSLRFGFGVLCLASLVAWSRPRWPPNAKAWMHVVIAGLLMHAGNLGGSHYAQYLGMSAGVTALILGTQPLLTALLLLRREPLTGRQWAGIALGLVGVGLVVGRKVDAHAASSASLVAVVASLLSITIGTLYQRRWCAEVDLRSAGLIQFAATLVVLAPLAVGVEGFVVHWDWRLAAAVAYLVVGGSILAINALHTLMRHGSASRVTSLLYLTPIVAVFLEMGVVSTSVSRLAVDRRHRRDVRRRGAGDVADADARRGRRELSAQRPLVGASRVATSGLAAGRVRRARRPRRQRRSAPCRVASASPDDR